MPVWPDLTHLQYTIRFLVEGLLSHGTFSVPEIGDLLTELRRYQPEFHEPILEGLFRWTRRGALCRDLRGTFFRALNTNVGHTPFMSCRRRAPREQSHNAGNTFGPSSAVSDHAN